MAKGILPENVAVLLLRMSSAKQDKSISAQRAELLKLAKRKGYTIRREYVDEAVSGDATEKRKDGFLRLRQDCENGPDFSIILVWHEDRFSRNDPLELGYWLKPIRDSGVVVETPTGRVDWESLGGRLVYLIGQEMRHDFLRTLSKNTTRGLLAGAREARTGTGGRSPQGLCNDPERAAIVLRMGTDYLKSGASLRSVADGLNRDGLLSPKGKPWSITTVRYVLRNRKYCGDFVRFRFRAGKYNGVRGGEIVSRKKTDRFEEVKPEFVVEGHHEAIFDRRTFNAIQEKLARQKRDTAHRTGRRYAFSGILRCGDCGLVMGGRLCTRHRERLVYRCHTYTDGGKNACYSNSIQEEPLLDCVVRMIEKEYLSEGAISRILAKFRNRLITRRSAPVDDSRLRKRIGDLDRQIDQGAERVLSAPENLVGTIYAKLEKLRQERDRLQGQLQAAEHDQDGSGGDLEKKIEAAAAVLQDLRQAFRDADPEDLRDLLRRIVVRVEVKFSHRHKGNRIDNTPQGGTIFVRPDPSISSLLFRSPTT